jgi:adenosine 3'-phospho 5'-phosphosulfate transporter B2
MLRYLAFPVQVMAKSCKLLPSMIMGRMVNGTRYNGWQYAQAVGAMVCVIVMHLSEEHTESGGSANGWMGNVIAISLLIIFFVCDSFTSQYQTALYKKHPNLSQTQMMLAGNIMGLLISLVFVASSWSSVSASLALVVSNPAVLGRILALGLSGAMGQFCIYTAIKVLGPLAFTWMMTVRQLLSVLISLVVFGHSVTPVKLACILTVFAIMSSKQLSRAYHAMRRTSCGPSRVVGVASPSVRRLLSHRVSTIWGDHARPKGECGRRLIVPHRVSTFWGGDAADSSPDGKED